MKDYKKAEINFEDKIAKDYNLKLSVAENIPSEQMNNWYNKLKVFVSYPTKNAGFNLCWIEALASGVPIVLGNEEGIGIKNAKKNWKKLTWEKNVNKLEEVFNMYVGYAYKEHLRGIVK